MKPNFSILVIGACFLCMVCCCQAQELHYKIEKGINLTDDGSWDYCTMDESAGLLYVSHDTEVQVVNIRTGKLVATLDGLNHVHGIALAPKIHKGFISSGNDAMVLVFDLKTHKPLEKIKTTGDNPDCILYDPFTNRVFTFNGKSANSTVIDAKTLKVIGTIPLDGKPEFAQSTGNGKVYVNLENKSEIAVINPLTMKVEQVWSISPGMEPSGLALDNKTHRLFSVCGNEMMVIVNAESGEVITTLPTGGHTDGCVFDPKTKRAFASNGAGTMTVVQEVDENTFTVLENISTAQGAKTIAIDRQTHHLYLPTADFGPAPDATIDAPNPKAKRISGSFKILEITSNLI